MRAVLARGPGRYELTDLPYPDRPEGGRVLAVEAVGVCAADRMLWSGTGPWRVDWPIVPGHELVGRDVDTGHRFTAEVCVPCTRCRHCRAGRGNLCTRGRHVGSDLPGGFAEYLALPAHAVLHPVPADLPVHAAVLAEPLACAVHAANRAGVGADDTVAVLGLGSVGALAVHVAASRGARRVLAVVRSERKAALARALGAEPLRPAEVGEAADTADAVLECSGDASAVDDALRLAAPGGRVCLYGVYRSPATVDANRIAEFKELTVCGGHLAPGCFPEAIGLLSGVPVELIVTAVRPLADVADALDASGGPRVKEVLVP